MKKEEHPLSGYRVDNAPDDPNVFVFETVNRILYEVQFKPSGCIFANDPDIQEFVFEISIAVIENPTGKRPPGDPLVPLRLPGYSEISLNSMNGLSSISAIRQISKAG